MALSSLPVTDTEQVLVAKPNRSATPALLAGVFLALSLVCAVVVGFSVSQGNLLAPPFALLNLMAFGGCLILAWRRGEDEDRIEVRGDSLVIERLRRRGRDHVEFNVYWAQAWLGPGVHPGRPRRVLVGSHGKAIEVGSFLIEEERQELLVMIRAALARSTQTPWKHQLELA